VENILDFKFQYLGTDQWQYIIPQLCSPMECCLGAYLDTFPKNDVISFSRKSSCALGLKLAEIRLNTFSVKHPFGKVYYIRMGVMQQWRIRGLIGMELSIIEKFLKISNFLLCRFAAQRPEPYLVLIYPWQQVKSLRASLHALLSLKISSMHRLLLIFKLSWFAQKSNFNSHWKRNNSRHS